MGSETPESEALFQRDLARPYGSPFFFVRDTPSTEDISLINSSSTIDSSSIEQVVPSNVIPSSPLRSAGPILDASVSEEEHSVPNNN